MELASPETYEPVLAAPGPAGPARAALRLLDRGRVWWASAGYLPDDYDDLTLRLMKEVWVNDRRIKLLRTWLDLQQRPYLPEFAERCGYVRRSRARERLLPAVCVRPADSRALPFLAAARGGGCGYERGERHVDRGPDRRDLPPVQFDAAVVHAHTVAGAAPRRPGALWKSQFPAAGEATFGVLAHDHLVELVPPVAREFAGFRRRSGGPRRRPDAKNRMPSLDSFALMGAPHARQISAAGGRTRWICSRLTRRQVRLGGVEKALTGVDGSQRHDDDGAPPRRGAVRHSSAIDAGLRRGVDRSPSQATEADGLLLARASMMTTCGFASKPSSVSILIARAWSASV